MTFLWRVSTSPSLLLCFWAQSSSHMAAEDPVDERQTEGLQGMGWRSGGVCLWAGPLLQPCLGHKCRSQGPPAPTANFFRQWKTQHLTKLCFMSTVSERNTTAQVCNLVLMLVKVVPGATRSPLSLCRANEPRTLWKPREEGQGQDGETHFNQNYSRMSKWISWIPSEAQLCPPGQVLCA